MSDFTIIIFIAGLGICIALTNIRIGLVKDRIDILENYIKRMK